MINYLGKEIKFKRAFSFTLFPLVENLCNTERSCYVVYFVELINYIQSWSATWPRIWLQLTSFARPRCETPHRLQCIWTLYTIYWFGRRRIYYCPPTKLWEGNVFIHVCPSVSQSVSSQDVSMWPLHDALDLTVPHLGPHLPASDIW